MKSTVDWCELNYSVSEYIAEYWNTVTGIFLIISGLVFYNLNNKWIQSNNAYIQNRFLNIRNLLILVGVGTMLFHGTLLYPFQLLDELPMLMLSREYILTLIELQTTEKSFNKRQLRSFDLVVLITKFLPVIISLSYFIYPILQVISFHITLKIAEISVITLLYTLSNKLNKIAYTEIYNKYNYLNITRQTKQSNVNQSVDINFETNTVNRLKNRNKKSNLLKYVQSDIGEYIVIRKKMSQSIKSGLFYYGISIGIWCVENIFCEYIQHLQLHAVWHLLSSIGIYHLNHIIVYHVMIDNMLS
jgi:hypothetical protein